MPAPKPPAFETLSLHAGQHPDPTTGSRAVPIYQTTSYVFKDTNHAANLFALKEFGNIYTRLMNPTTDVVEQRIASLEGGVGALLVSSGQAAETLAILNIAEAGSHVVASPSLYGGTFNLLKFTLPKYGIDVTFVENPNDLASWEAAVRPNTKLFFAETIANPKVEVLDIEGVAGVAHAAGVPLVVDNTFGAGGYIAQPLRAYEKTAIWTVDPKNTPYRDGVKNMRPAGYAGKLGYASAGAAADFIVVNMVAEAISGSKTPKELSELMPALEVLGK